MLPSLFYRQETQGSRRLLLQGCSASKRQSSDSHSGSQPVCMVEEGSWIACDGQARAETKLLGQGATHAWKAQRQFPGGREEMGL